MFAHNLTIRSTSEVSGYTYLVFARARPIREPLMQVYKAHASCDVVAVVKFAVDLVEEDRSIYLS